MRSSCSANTNGAISRKIFENPIRQVCGSSPIISQWPPWRRRIVSPIHAPNVNQTSQWSSALRSSSSLSPIWPNSQVSNVISSSDCASASAPGVAFDLGDRRDGLALGIDQLLDDQLGLTARARREPIRALAQLGHRLLEALLGLLLGGGELLGALGLLAGLGHDGQSIRVSAADNGSGPVTASDFDRRYAEASARMCCRSARRCTRSRSRRWPCSSSTTGCSSRGSARARVTGKLSDVAGLASAPVVLTAAIGLVLLARARGSARASIRR